MTRVELLRAADLDMRFEVPAALERLVSQSLTNLAPWQVMDRELAVKRLTGLRSRYSRKYVPFARRQDNDDLACLEPGARAGVVIVHDFADEGTEVRQEFPTFWDWFRAAVEDMIAFE